MVLWLPDSKLETPELMEPGRKPVENVKIDYEHNLAPKHLCALFGSSDFDLSNNNDLSGINTVFTKNGKTARLTTTSSYDLDNPILLSNSDKYTIVCRIKETGATTEGMICGNNANTRDFLWAQDGTGLQFRNSVITTTYKFATIVTFSTMTDIAFSTSGEGASSSTLKAYQDGVFKEQKTGITSSFDIYSIFNGYTSSSFNFVGDMVYLYIYDKELNAHQIRSLYENPYQFLIPA